MGHPTRHAQRSPLARARGRNFSRGLVGLLARHSARDDEDDVDWINKKNGGARGGPHWGPIVDLRNWPLWRRPVMASTRNKAVEGPPGALIGSARPNPAALSAVAGLAATAGPKGLWEQIAPTGSRTSRHAPGSPVLCLHAASRRK